MTVRIWNILDTVSITTLLQELPANRTGSQKIIGTGMARFGDGGQRVPQETSYTLISYGFAENGRAHRSTRRLPASVGMGNLVADTCSSRGLGGNDVGTNTILVRYKVRVRTVDASGGYEAGLACQCRGEDDMEHTARAHSKAHDHPLKGVTVR
jgi:hypothetical protein